MSQYNTNNINYSCMAIILSLKKYQGARFLYIQYLGHIFPISVYYPCSREPFRLKVHCPAVPLLTFLF